MSQMGVFGFGGSGGDPILTLTGDDGSPVSPDGAGNINLLGTAGLIDTTGNPGSNEITWDLDGSVPNSFQADSGTATPTGHVLSVFGDGNIDTLGAGAQLSLSLAGVIANQYTTDDANTAVPSGNNLNVFGGDGISTTSSGDTVTISADNAGFTWSVITSGVTAEDNNGYFTNDAGAVSVMLPATSSVGDTFQVVAMSAGGWVITQGAGQSITIDTVTTTVGASGSISSNKKGDWVTVICNVANTSWMAKIEQGNVNVV